MIETFPYGEIPLNGLCRDFTEHRIFEMILLSHNEGKIDFSVKDLILILGGLFLFYKSTKEIYHITEINKDDAPLVPNNSSFK